MRIKVLNWLTKSVGPLLVTILFFSLAVFAPSNASIQDEIPPTITDVLYFPDPPEAAEPINIMCTVTDNVAVSTVRVTITPPGGTSLEGTMKHLSPSYYYYTSTYFIPGTYTYRIRATDTSGNEQTTPIYSFQLSDTKAPVTQILYPNGGEYIRGIMTIQWTAVDAADQNLNDDITLEYSTDGGANRTLIASNLLNDGDYDLNTTSLPDGGLYTLFITATDDANNTGTDSSDAPFIIDNTPPVTNISIEGTAGKNGWYIDDVIVDLEATDETSGILDIFYRIDKGNWSFYTVSLILTTEGNHSFEYYSVDNAGNSEALKSVNIKMDWTKPHVNISKPLPNHLYIFDRDVITLSIDTPIIIGDITVQVTVVNETSGINWMGFDVDYTQEANITEAPWEWDWSDPSLIARKYQLTVRAYDWAGNTETANLIVRKWL